MKLFPQLTRIVVEPIPHEDTPLVIPEGFKDSEGEEINHYPRWRVVEKGPGRRLDDGTIEPIPLEVGDEVVVDPRFGTRLEPITFYANRKLMVIEYGAVLAKVERDPGERVSRFAPPKHSKIVVAQPIAAN